MNKMSNKTKMLSFYVEGPDWSHTVSLNPELFDDERAQMFEAATLAIEKQMKDCEELNLGAILLVKKSKAAKKEAMVNAYLCLVNVGQYVLAENLRENFKKSSGQDLSQDKNGYSYE
jgi:hypothetical protein